MEGWKVVCGEVTWLCFGCVEMRRDEFDCFVKMIMTMMNWDTKEMRL